MMMMMMMMMRFEAFRPPWLNLHLRIHIHRWHYDPLYKTSVNGCLVVNVGSLLFSKKSPAGPIEQTPKPEYLIARSQLT